MAAGSKEWGVSGAVTPQAAIEETIMSGGVNLERAKIHALYVRRAQAALTLLPAIIGIVFTGQWYLAIKSLPATQSPRPPTSGYGYCPT